MLRFAAILAGAGIACVAQGQTPAAGTTMPSAAPCAQPEAHQFDFWIGEWTVTKPDGTPAGSSRIEAILDGCVVLEHWTSATPPYAGKSLNLYNRNSGQWEQFWVDNTGSRLHLVGGIEDGRMVLRGSQDAADPKTGVTQRERIAWTRQDDGGVRQLWETSTDGGASWKVSFDGRYRRAKHE